MYSSSSAHYRVRQCCGLIPNPERTLLYHVAAHPNRSFKPLRGLGDVVNVQDAIKFLKAYDDDIFNESVYKTNRSKVLTFFRDDRNYRSVDLSEAFGFPLEKNREEYKNEE